LAACFADLAGRVAGLAARFADLAGRVAGLAARFADLAERVAALRGRFARFATRRFARVEPIFDLAVSFFITLPPPAMSAEPGPEVTTPFLSSRMPRTTALRLGKRRREDARLGGADADAMIRTMPAAHGGVEFLRSCPVLAALPVKELGALAAVARDERYRARDLVFMEGDPPLWFCLVRSGRVRIFRQSRGGKDVVLELLGPGELFGGVAVIEKRPYPASAQTTEPSVVTKLPQDAVVALAERYPSIIKEMALMIGRRLRAAHDSVTSLAADPVEARLAATLLRLAEREGMRGPRGMTVPFHLTRQSLADMTGTTVETTIRTVGRWLRDGLVREEANRLVLTDLAGLRALAEAGRD
jgi:CRP-like cAMP-binding protein